MLVMLWCSYGDDLKCLGDILVMCWCCFGDALARLGPCILKFFRVLVWSVRAGVDRAGSADHFRPPPFSQG